jgi:hypothetical protein
LVCEKGFRVKKVGGEFFTAFFPTFLLFKKDIERSIYSSDAYWFLFVVHKKGILVLTVFQIKVQKFLVGGFS